MDAFKISVVQSAVNDIIAECELVPIAVAAKVKRGTSPSLDRLLEEPGFEQKLGRKLPIALGAAWCCVTSSGPKLIAPSRIEGEAQEKIGWSYALHAALNACEVLGYRSIKLSLEGLDTDEVDDLSYALTFISRGYFGPVAQIVIVAPDDVVHCEFSDRTLDVVNELWAA
jgi:hypothetical protein